MERIIHEGSPKTPLIKVDAESGYVLIKGRSNPENSQEFYSPLISWMEEYIIKPAALTLVEINLEHFNTSTSKCLLDFLKRLKLLKETGKDIHIKWFYEDDDEEMLETAEIYESMTGLSFEKIGVPEEEF